MKKSLLILACGMIAPLFLACSLDSEQHATTVYYPYSGRAMVYADQPRDSLWFVTTESWTVKSDASWCTIQESITDVKNPYANTLVEVCGSVFFQPNLTGKWRSAIVTLGGGDYIAQVAYFQAPHLHLIRPGRSFDENGFPTKLYTLTDSATWTADSITFETFDKWTLQAQGTLLNPVVTAGEAGRHTVRFEMNENTTANQRTDTLLLTSRGVTDKIPVVQLPLSR